MSGFQRVEDPQAALAWIPAEVREDGDLCGMDATGWEDDTWILHDLTVPLDTRDPEQGPRARCRWRDVVETDLTALQGMARWPPNAMHLLKDQRWPDVCIEEGTFDGESRAALLEILTAVSGPSAQCFAYFGMVPANNYDRPTVLKGALSQVASLTSDGLPQWELSPSNWWPVDRSWFVWTDYDLTATRVSGSRNLIDQVRSHTALETLDWRGPVGGGGS
ncbi:hypothetical protein [Myceligenerans xiligouense]|uniref:Uncharacterized protein n=1 Tax=Myceligenerans xiligouense TaxID=253184 RepID=A0A3N4Z9L9_9MICO|nr:hypothetical protein [Myceligenerans xiligouense]RPF22548.1 hypothetical protein EDD34_3215 [Myceligenerans xiligouense]